MKFEKGKKYRTKSGNIIEVVAVTEKQVIAKYVKINAPGHEKLSGKGDYWTLDGKWEKYPGGIHDVVAAEA